MTTTNELRVMTYNVRSLRDDVEALGSLVRAQAPDVLLVQEAPRFLRWRSKRAALARRCGLVVATADRPGGLCVMTSMRVDLVSSSFVLLPKHPRLHQRALVTATLAFGGHNWRVASMHLSGNAEERREHLPAIYSALAVDSTTPLIVGGDVNEDPGGPVFAEFASRWQDTFAVAGSGHGLTNPADAPKRRIDAIFADASFTVVSSEAVDVPGVAIASDHRPVLAVLRLA